MSMPVPIVGQDPGPDWANNLNACLGILDQHTHGPGQGLRITPLGININTDLTMNNNNLIAVNTVNFQAHIASLPGTAPNLGCIYVAGNELYYNDESGNVVPITNNGSVNAGAGSITGLPSGTASASYSSGNQTFVWQSATSTPANMDFGSAIIREVAANAKGITISSPSALPADYTITFPNSTPASLSFLMEDNGGNLSYSQVDNSTLEISGTTLQVKDAGITTVKIADLNVTRPKLSPLGQQISSSTGNLGLTTSGTFITANSAGSFSVTITTTGRPVLIFLQNDGSGNPAYFTGTTGVAGYFRFFRDSTTEVSQYYFQPPTTNSWNTPSSCMTLDLVSAGTYTYEGQIKSASAGTTFGLQFYEIVAYEL